MLQHIGSGSMVMASFQQTLWTVQPVSSGAIKNKALCKAGRRSSDKLACPIKWDFLCGVTQESCSRLRSVSTVFIRT